jgi:DNA-binding NarL/FixJ family response regulator
MKAKIKVLLVDDHEMFRDGVKLLFSSGSLAEIVGEAVNGKEFLELFPVVKPDIVLLDISMPVMDGIEAAQIANRQFPGIKILVLTMFGDERYYYKLISAGVKGFILKSSGISELLEAIKHVSEGHSFFSKELLLTLVNTLNSAKAAGKDMGLHNGEKLSKREIEVLKEIAAGLSNESIGEKLHISATTVRTHRANLLLKTSTNNTASLIMYAIKNNIIEMEKMT